MVGFGQPLAAFGHVIAALTPSFVAFRSRCASTKCAPDWCPRMFTKPNRDRIFDSEPPPPRASSVNIIARSRKPDESARATSEGDDLQFIRFAMHDLQTPVAVLEMTLKLLEEDLSSATDETRATLRGAQRAARRIQQHIDHLVTSERLSSGRLVPRRQPMDLAVVLKELVADYEDQGNNLGVHVHLDLGPKAKLPLRADPILLVRIFQNLVENALRHVDKGGRVLIRARRGSAIEVEVCNDGPAISPTDRSGLFAKVARAAHASTAAGLGLKFCRLAVAAHGGTIALEEDLEWPTCFVVRLPLATI